jgi:hypothetical protein
MADQFFVVFKMHGEKFFYRRESEVAGRPSTRPEVTRSMAEARALNADFAISLRDRLREMYRNEPAYEIYIEDSGSNGPHFERRTVDPVDSEDTRSVLFVSPDRYQHLRLGFLVRPAIRPEGKCWVVCTRDIPSMSEHLDCESVYSNDPVDAVERAMVLWSDWMQPIESPWSSKRLQKTISDFRKETISLTGRRRPGDR